MHMTYKGRANALVALGLGIGLSAALLGGCEETKEALETDITGQVLDDRGEPVVGATVRLYALSDNTDFVEGSDISSAEAYINREAVLSSNNTVASGQTGADGRFKVGAIPNAFLAVVVKEGCSAGFAGFDAETGVLNLQTLITPNLDDGLNFKVDGFVLACATPPEDLGPEGNAPDAPELESPPGTVSCDAATCEAAGGTCEEQTCVTTCVSATCEAAGGSCLGGECGMPTCDTEVCEAAGGVCADDGLTCALPACRADADCQVGQPGAFCEQPGDVALAACRPPLPGEIVAPAQPVGWSGFRVTDAAGELLADAADDNRLVATADIPNDGTVRVYGDYAGSADTAYVQVQSGGQACANFPPKTDFIAVDVTDGKLTTPKGDFVELALHGGYQRIQLSTSETLGEGERSFVIEVGEPCAPPAHAFTAILSWDAGRGQPADLDLNVWSASGELLFVGTKQAAWGQLKCGQGPGPEVFESDDVSQGPFTIKVQFFSGKPRDVRGKVRILRTVDGQLLDKTYEVSVGHPKDVADVGVFAGE